MKRITSVIVVAVVLMVTAVSCTAVRSYGVEYDNGYYSNAPMYYGSIDPFTGFYYNNAPYGYYSYYSAPYIYRSYGGHSYYNSRPAYRGNQSGHVQRNWNYNSQQRGGSQQRQQQTRSDARARVFGNRSR